MGDNPNTTFGNNDCMERAIYFFKLSSLTASPWKILADSGKNLSAMCLNDEGVD